MHFSPIGEGTRKPCLEEKPSAMFSPVKAAHRRIKRTNSPNGSAFNKGNFRNSVHANQPVLMDGVLKKMSSNSAIKRWQDRFFTLEGQYFKYFAISMDGGKGQELKGTIDLRQLANVQNHFDIIKLVMTSGEIAHLKASTQEDAATWTQMLRDTAPGESQRL
jgi:hypothetical protein